MKGKNMAEIIKESGVRELSHFVKTSDGKPYYVDSNCVFDSDFETMVFNCEEEMTLDTVDWTGVYERHYKNIKEMQDGHLEIIKNLEEFI